MSTPISSIIRANCEVAGPAVHAAEVTQSISLIERRRRGGKPEPLRLSGPIKNDFKFLKRSLAHSLREANYIVPISRQQLIYIASLTCKLGLNDRG